MYTCRGNDTDSTCQANQFYGDDAFMVTLPIQPQTYYFMAVGRSTPHSLPVVDVFVDLLPPARWARHACIACVYCCVVRARGC